MAPVRSRSDSGFPAPEISWPVKPDNANPFPKAVATPCQQMPRRTNRRPAREPGPRSQDLWHLSDGPVRKVDNLGLPTETRKQVKGPKDMTTMPGHHAVNHRGEIIMEMPKRTPVGNGTSCARPSAVGPITIPTGPTYSPVTPRHLLCHMARRAVQRRTPHLPALPEHYSGV